MVMHNVDINRLARANMSKTIGWANEPSAYVQIYRGNAADNRVWKRVSMVVNNAIFSVIRRLPWGLKARRYGST